jgi:hypothetical protein
MEISGNGDRCTDDATPSIRKKLTLTSPTSGGRSVDIVRLRPKSTELKPLCTAPTESPYFLKTLFTAPLPSNRYPTSPLVCFCGNVLSDGLRSKRHGADHMENTSCDTFSIIAYAYFGYCLAIGLHVTIYFQE